MPLIQSSSGVPLNPGIICLPRPHQSASAYRAKNLFGWMKRLAHFLRRATPRRIHVSEKIRIDPERPRQSVKCDGVGQKIVVLHAHEKIEAQKINGPISAGLHMANHILGRPAPFYHLLAQTFSQRKGAGNLAGGGQKGTSSSIAGFSLC